MNPIEIVALSKVIKKTEGDLARDQVLPGDYSVDFTVRISGPITVEEDYMKDPTVSVPWTEAYALLREIAIQGVDEMIARVDRGETITRADLEVIKTAGFLSESLIVDCIQKAFVAKNLPEGQGAIIELVPEVKAAQERAKAAISKRIGKTPSNGRVLTELTVNQVQAVQTPAGSVTPAQAASSLPANVHSPATP